MNLCCKYCSALKWNREPPGLCCSNGKIRLPLIKEPPEPLRSLLNGKTSESKTFLQNIRTYNSLFTMTSFKTTEIKEKWQPTVKIQG